MEKKLTYAQQKNLRFCNSTSNFYSLSERWNNSYNSLHVKQQELVDYALQSAIGEFRRRNPNITQWSDLPLAEAKSICMNEINIDGTMQRQLDIFWVLSLLNEFMSTMVVPIQVYKHDADQDRYLAWDGQHTAVLLWIIATKILKQDPALLQVPVNIYRSCLKSQMRANFIKLNSSQGKKQLDTFDLWEQMVYGVRIDAANDPLWQETERKQQEIESAGLFVTSTKFVDCCEPGAITRLNEFNKFSVETVKWLSKYLAYSTKLLTPVDEKETVIIAHYLNRCKVCNIPLSEEYISDLYSCLYKLFQCDFSHSGPFWTAASSAYYSWHSFRNIDSSARFNKDLNHGFPFLIAQLQKSFNRPVPRCDSTSDFWPLPGDLI